VTFLVQKLLGEMEKSGTEKTPGVYVTFLVQKLLGEMEKSGTEKTPGVTRFQKPAVISQESFDMEHIVGVCLCEIKTRVI